MRSTWPYHHWVTAHRCQGSACTRNFRGCGKFATKKTQLTFPERILSSRYGISRSGYGKPEVPPSHISSALCTGIFSNAQQIYPIPPSGNPRNTLLSSGEDDRVLYFFAGDVRYQLRQLIQVVGSFLHDAVIPVDATRMLAPSLTHVIWGLNGQSCTDIV